MYDILTNPWTADKLNVERSLGSQKFVASVHWCYKRILNGLGFSFEEFKCFFTKFLPNGLLIANRKVMSIYGLKNYTIHLFIDTHDLNIRKGKLL